MFSERLKTWKGVYKDFQTGSDAFQRSKRSKTAFDLRNVENFNFVEV